MKTARSAIAILAFGILATACGGSSGSISVDDAWARPTPPAAANAAFYMTLTGGAEADTLVAAESDLCGATEIHESTMTDGTMSMSPVPDGVRIPAGKTVAFEPGGFHIMCLDIVDPIELDQEVDVELSFESGETIRVSVIGSEGPGDMDEMDHGDMGDGGHDDS